MAILVVCPSGHRMTLPDHKAGKRHRCPLCFGYIEVPLPGQAPASQQPAPASIETNGVSTATPSPTPASLSTLSSPVDEASVPQAENLLEHIQAFFRVDRGLGVHYARLVILLWCIVGLMVLLIGEATLRDDVKTALTIVVSFGAFLVCPILGLIGSLLCVRVPSETQGRNLLLSSLVLDVVTLGFAYFPLGSALKPEHEVLAQTAASALGFGSWALFFWFLSRLANYLNQQVARDDAFQIILKGLVLFVIVPAIIWIACLIVLELGGFFMVLFGIIGVPVGIYLLIAIIRLLLQQLALIGTLRQAIRSKV